MAYNGNKIIIKLHKEAVRELVAKLVLSHNLEIIRLFKVIGWVSILFLGCVVFQRSVDLSLYNHFNVAMDLGMLVIGGVAVIKVLAICDNLFERAGIKKSAHSWCNLAISDILKLARDYKLELDHQTPYLSHYIGIHIWESLVGLVRDKEYYTGICVGLQKVVIQARQHKLVWDSYPEHHLSNMTHKLWEYEFTARNLQQVLGAVCLAERVRARFIDYYHLIGERTQWLGRRDVGFDVIDDLFMRSIQAELNILAALEVELGDDSKIGCFRLAG